MRTPLILLTSCIVFAQPATFDVASVKPSKPGDTHGATFQFKPGGLEVTNATLRGLIEMAYDVRDFQISGGPGWVSSAGYYVSAKSAGDAPQSIPEVRRKLQALLAQRFQLKVHRESRQIPMYALEVGKNGAKLKEAGGSLTGIRSGCGQMTGMRATMANLTIMLSRQLGRPVLDRTALAGEYGFELRWRPDAGACAEPAGDAPSIFAALQEQLGLKLEPTKGPVEIVVVDYAEKADAN